MRKIDNFKKFKLNESSNETDRLINHINTYLLPKYELTVQDIPTEHINVSRNITKSTKCVTLNKKGDSDDIYSDWYYDEFNSKNLEDYCYRMSFIDRDMDVSLAYEFKDISQRIKSALDNFNFQGGKFLLYITFRNYTSVA